MFKFQIWSFFNDVKKIAGVVLVYETRVTGGAMQIASDSIAAEWVSVERALEFPLAFETHRSALDEWRGKTTR